MKFIVLYLLLAADFSWNLPSPFPRPTVPADNPMTAAKIELGRHLFYDKRLSVNGRQSCSTCHRQALAFTDGRAHARGATGQLHARSSMSLVNVAYLPSLTWIDQNLTSLEAQALVPMLGETPIEMGLKGHETDLLTALPHDARYQDLFPRAFPGETDPYTLSNLTKAIASFERTIVSMRSPYDRYRWGGDAAALSDAAKRGELLFFSSEHAGCFRCHAGWNFSGNVLFEGSKESVTGNFFNTGVSPGAERFRVPSLRNVAVSAPYMHDGSLATLEDVIDHYAAGGKYDNPNKSTLLHPLHLTPAEKSDLIEFLKSLTDEELLHDPRFSNPWLSPYK